MQHKAHQTKNIQLESGLHLKPSSVVSQSKPDSPIHDKISDKVNINTVTNITSMSMTPNTSHNTDQANMVISSTAQLTINPNTNQNKDQKMNEDANTVKRSKENRPPHNQRYDQRGHFPKTDERKNGTRCKKEGCVSRTHFYCVKCDVHLCIANGKDRFHLQIS